MLHIFHTTCQQLSSISVCPLSGHDDFYQTPAGC